MKDTDTKRDSSGRYDVQKRCDCCGQPLHGVHITDDEVCGGDDGPGFFLCDRPRCIAARDTTVAQRRKMYTARRALNDARERTRRVRGKRAKPSKPGRKPSQNPRDVPKHLRLTKAEEQEQSAACAAVGLSWSAWIVRAAKLAAALESVARGELAAVPAHLWPPLRAVTCSEPGPFKR